MYTDAIDPVTFVALCAPPKSPRDGGGGLQQPSRRVRGGQEPEHKAPQEGSGRVTLGSRERDVGVRLLGGEEAGEETALPQGCSCGRLTN